MEMEREISILNIDDILPNRFQPRIQFNDKNINELADSIKEHGVIQPIVVRKISDKFEIIAGERRYKASVIAGKTTIPAIITNLDDKNSAEIALIENVQRQDLTPIEEAISYKKILDMGYLTQGDLALKLGKTQSTIANKLRLLNLDEEVQEALLEGKISERHARSLLRLDVKSQIIILNRIIDERLTVRKADEEIEKMLANKPEIIKEESVGNDMNDKIINQFNIPVNPIIEEPVVEQKEIINPGFMDITKIENHAEDIFKEEKPADIGMLLEKDQTVETITPMAAMQPVQPVEEPVQQAPTGGRFFTMFNLNKEEENPNFVENIESKEVNMDFGMPTAPTNMFNPLNISNQVEEEIIEPVAPVTVPTEETHSSFEQFNIAPVIEEKVEEVIAPSAPSFNNLFDEVKPVEPVVTPEIVSVEPVVEVAATPTFNPFGFTAFETEDNNGQQNVIEPVQPVELPVEEKVEEPAPFTEIKPFVLNEESEFTDFAVPPVVELEPTIEEVKPTTINSYNSDELMVRTDFSEPKADFRTVINLIRECTSKIEKLGYVIDTEEIDFDSNYQVVFKINKD